MSYQVVWILPYQVLYIQEEGRLELDDIRDSTRLVAEHMMDAQDKAPENTIIGIVDMQNASVNKLLRNALPLTIQSLSDVIDPRLWKLKQGFVVLITTSQSAKVIISLLIRLSAQPLTTVANFDEALAIIISMYPELATPLNEFKATDAYNEMMRAENNT